MAAPGVGCMISAGRYALGLDPVAHRAPSGSGDASPHELSRREDNGSNHREPDERAHRRERMRDCEHAIVEVAPGAGKLHRPEGRDTQGLARGYCGLCLICGEPGHTRPHPGAVEFTGSWCDFHYGVLAVTHPLAPVGTFVWLAVIAAIIFTAGQLMR